MKNYKNYLFIIPILVLTLPLKRESLSGVCVRVLDGDTIIVQRGTKLEKVRLAFIDAPEISQFSIFNKIRIGEKSKEFLEQKILNKNVLIKLYGRGKYKRWIGEVFYKGENINLAIVLSGNAVLYKFKKYPTNYHRADYHSSQFLAQNKRVGIWGSYGFENPQHYRRRGGKNVKQ